MSELFSRPINYLPIAAFQEISLEQLNECLLAWKHKMGPLKRPNYGDGWYYGLFHESRPIGVVAANRIIAKHVGGGLQHLKRPFTVELSRLCAERAHLCRVVLRLWRELAFPSLSFMTAISYQDADLHNGNTYRFDGWRRSPKRSYSGTDARSDRKGRNKWIWVWPPEYVQVDAVNSLKICSEGRFFD